MGARVMPRALCRFLTCRRRGKWVGNVKKNLYLVAPIAGYTPQIGRLVSMMNYARRTTLDEVEGLSVEHLDYLHDPQSNSIGALLLHIAAVEASYQEATFGSRGAANETGPWEVALDLGARSR